MNFFNDERRWELLLDRFSEEKKANNKGERFENLVYEILKKMFADKNMDFKYTKKTHDGSKDFWALDDKKQLWWAECKNYTSGIGMKELSPTLFMAELYDIDYILFFSYSPLNENLLRKIGLYSNNHRKKVFIYDDDALEFIILDLFSGEVNKIFGRTPKALIGQPRLSEFNEKNPMFFNADNFDGYYGINKLVLGEVYNINKLVVNRSDKTIGGKSEIGRSKDMEYVRMIGGQTPVSFELRPFELMLFTWYVQVVKTKEKLALPKINVTFGGGSVNTEKKSGGKRGGQKYVCEYGRDSVLVGENYERIIKNAVNVCHEDNLSCFLIYGSGGCGKTRVLYECYLDLLVNRSRVLNFTDFDSGNNWKDVLKEIVYNIFSIGEDVALDILCNMQSGAPDDEFECELSHEEKSIYKFFEALKTNSRSEDLNDYYEIIFEKMLKGNYAIIIDNFQSYSPELADFFEKMINYFSNCNRRFNISLLFSINVDLIFDNAFSEFIGRFISMKNERLNSHFYCEEITGFNSYEQAMVLLNSRLGLSEFPMYSYAKSIIREKGVLKPKYIEQMADYLINKECVIIRDGIGYVPDNARLINCLSEVPSEYKRLFAYNYGKIAKNCNCGEDALKLIFSAIYLFGKIERKHTEIFDLSAEGIDTLLRHGMIKNNGSADFPVYTAEHDLSLECVSSYIYTDLIVIASNKVMALSDSARAGLGMNDAYLMLCGLVRGNINDIKNIDVGLIEKLHNRHKYIFAEYLLNYCVNSLTDAALMIRKANEICIYVNDHIGAQKAESLFGTAYETIRSIPCDDPSIIREAFSFYIHMAENKMHMSKHKEVLKLYDEFDGKIKAAKESGGLDGIKKELDYAKAYILNRRFVCGKIEGDVSKRAADLDTSKALCEKYGFWDIQFENFFDEANIYKYSDKRGRFSECLAGGFEAFRKASPAQKKKFMPNFISKKLQYMCVGREFENALKLSDKALDYLNENRNINYHIFFKVRYLKYKFISLSMLDKPEQLGDLLRELSIFHDLSGSADKFEILYYDAVYSFLTKDTDQMAYFFERMYVTASSEKKSDPIYGVILKDIGLKLRLLRGGDFEPRFSLDSLNKSFIPVNEVLTADIGRVKKINEEFVPDALITNKTRSLNFYF